MDQLETVLLEDDQNDLDLVKRELEQRGIIVHAYRDGNEALRMLRTDPHIEVFLTDIAIDYPNEVRSKLQGYGVANAMYRDHPDRYLGTIVLSGLGPEQISDSYSFHFKCPIVAFHKEKWLKLDPSDTRSWKLTFDFLAELVIDTARQSWSRWEKLVSEVSPKSLWISRERPYLPTYIGLRRSKDWRALESAIGNQAMEIVGEYRKGNLRSLQGEYVKLSEQPNASLLREHLIARRVVYAVRKIEPAYWEGWLQGIEGQEEERRELDFWEGIESDELKSTLNGINRLRAELAALEKERDLSKENVAGRKKHCVEQLVIHVKKVITAAAGESDTVQRGVAGVVSELQSQLRSSDASGRSQRKSKPKPKPANRLQATLRLLGIEKKHIKDPDPNNWKLLLPEEVVWLKSIRS